MIHKSKLYAKEQKEIVDKIFEILPFLEFVNIYSVDNTLSHPSLPSRNFLTVPSLVKTSNLFLPKVYLTNCGILHINRGVL